MQKNFAYLLLAVAAVGCDDTPDTSQVDTFIHTLAQQSCEWEFRCCKDAEIQIRDGNKFTTKDRCIDYRALELEDQLYIDRLAVKEGRLRVDTTRETACLGQLASMQCNPDPNNPTPTPIQPMQMDACANVFVGTTPVGAECIYANECVEGAHCVNDQLAVGRGVCVPYQKVTEICNESADCDPSVPQIYCAKQDFTCRVRGKLGDPCAYTIDAFSNDPALPLLLECDSTQKLYCDPLSRTCKTLPEAGQPCLSPLPPGVTSRCDPDPLLKLVCDTGTTGTGGICRAPGKLGDDCTRVPCDKNFYCDRSVTPDTCRALPTLGQACDVSGGECLDPYFCNFNKFPAVCDQPARLGQDCSMVTCDLHLYCDSFTKTCFSQLPDGAICTADQQCLSFDCRLVGGNTTTQTCQPSLTGPQCIGR